MEFKGKTWKFGNDVDTDQIIPSQYLVMPDIKEMAQYTMEPQNPDFAKEYVPGEILVGGKNFGCGSSREQAPLVLKELGVRVIIAESFARIFYRNTINLGVLPLEIVNTSGFNAGDNLRVTDSTVINRTQNFQSDFRALSGFLKTVIQKGGLVPYYREGN